MPEEGLSEGERFKLASHVVKGVVQLVLVQFVCSWAVQHHHVLVYVVGYLR
jgi:hypothetical protein